MKLSFCAKLALAGFVAAQLALAQQSQPPATPDEAPVVDTVRDPGPDLRDYVSPNLDPGEQGFMRSYINMLPRELKDRIAHRPIGSVSVIVVDGGTNTIHYNRPEDAGSYEVRMTDPLPGRDHPYLQRPPGAAIDPEANPEADLEADPDATLPGPYGGSGPYRRTFSKLLPAAAQPYPGDHTGYMQSGTVTTACQSGNFTKGDSGYIYMGGWSGTWDSLAGSNAVGSAIDAGLQYNYELSTESLDDYSMFIKVSGLPKDTTIITKGNSIDPFTKKPEPQPAHILCGRHKDDNTVHMTFAVVPATETPDMMPKCWQAVGTSDASNDPSDIIAGCQTYMLVLTAESFMFENQHDGDVHTGIIEYVAPILSQGGWGKLTSWKGMYYDKPATLYTTLTTCENCVFKWMTSIAQKKENLTDKSWFGAIWSDREISGFAYKTPWPQGGALQPLAADVTDCAEYPIWHAWNANKANTDCTTTPAGLKGTAQSVKVWTYSPAGEWDTIDLKY